MTHPSVSIIIPTRNRVAYLAVTLNSMLSLLESEEPFEVIVVDNGSTDNTMEFVQGCQSTSGVKIRYQLEKKPGLHHCRHAGARIARGELLVYVDDDVRVAAGWLEAMCRPFVDSRAGIVGGKVEPEWMASPPGWLAHVPTGYLSLLDLGALPLDLTWPAQVYGCNLAIRRDLLFSLGGFNPDGYPDRAFQWYRGDGETGLLLKAYAGDALVRYEPQAGIKHRIPPERLTKAYLFKRAFNQGISDSFTQKRRQSNATILGLLEKHSHERRVRILQRGNRVLRSLMASNGAFDVHLGIRLAYLHGRIGHSLRVMCDGRLRAHVHRPDFLDDRHRI